MKKLFGALVLFFAALAPAAAQITQVTLPPCWPGSLGSGEDFISGSAPTGRWWAWRCVREDGFDWQNFVVALKSDFNLNTVPKVKGESDVKYAERSWLANANTPCTDASISALCASALTAIKAVPARTPPAFVVASNGGNTTRPVYAISDALVIGALVPNVRATVGNECYCWARGVRKGNSAYCIFKGAETSLADVSLTNVALCVKK